MNVAHSQLGRSKEWGGGGSAVESSLFSTYLTTRPIDCRTVCLPRPYATSRNRLRGYWSHRRRRPPPHPGRSYAPVVGVLPSRQVAVFVRRVDKCRSCRHNCARSSRSFGDVLELRSSRLSLDPISFV